MLSKGKEEWSEWSAKAKLKKDYKRNKGNVEFKRIWTHSFILNSRKR